MCHAEFMHVMSKENARYVKGKSFFVPQVTMFITDAEKKIIDIMERLHFFDSFTQPEKREIASLNTHFRRKEKSPA